MRSLIILVCCFKLHLLCVYFAYRFTDRVCAFIYDVFVVCMIIYRVYVVFMFTYVCCLFIVCVFC